jgi:hypothetical protein
MQVRRIIGDVQIGDQQLQDEEIKWTLTLFSNIYLAAAQCCRDIAAQFSRKVDTVQGELRILYSAQARNYAARATEYQNFGMQRGGGQPYSGGISIADKTNQVENTDRVPPQFNIGMDDNLLPIGPVGNQTPTPGLPDGSDDGSTGP